MPQNPTAIPANVRHKYCTFLTEMNFAATEIIDEFKNIQSGVESGG